MLTRPVERTNQGAKHGGKQGCVEMLKMQHRYTIFTQDKGLCITEAQATAQVYEVEAVPSDSLITSSH